MAKNLVTAERLREVLRYDPDTGRFTWLVRQGRQSPGKPAGCVTPSGYVIAAVDGQHYRAHRLAWLYMTGAWPAAFIDHKNRDRADNRWANLREATKSQNGANQAPRSAHGFKGATYNKRQGRWVAQAKINGKPVYLGYHDTPEEAHEAYMAAMTAHFGEFARAA